MKKHQYRAVFISDVHLGFHGCQAEELVAFLKQTKTKTLYLLGDIIDIWALKGRFYWPSSHSEVIKQVLKMAHKGTEVYYVPGNHDHELRKYIGIDFGNIRVREPVIHTCLNGDRLLCLHGDLFDAVIQKHLWLAHIGSWLYDMLLSLSTRVSQLRKAAGRVHWSLSKYLKHKVKIACNYIGNYEQAVINEAKKQGVDGIVCGHIHHAAITEFDGVTYINTGDWVESLTAVVEHLDGKIEMLYL